MTGMPRVCILGLDLYLFGLAVFPFMPPQTLDMASYLCVKPLWSWRKVWGLSCHDTPTTLTPKELSLPRLPLCSMFF